MSQPKLSFKIEKGIPVPTTGTRSPLMMALKAAMEKLGKDESFTYEKKHQTSVGYLASEYHKKANGKGFITKKVSETHRRIWRIA